MEGFVFGQPWLRGASTIDESSVPNWSIFDYFSLLTSLYKQTSKHFLFSDGGGFCYSGINPKEQEVWIAAYKPSR